MNPKAKQIYCHRREHGMGDTILIFADGSAIISETETATKLSGEEINLVLSWSKELHNSSTEKSDFEQVVAEKHPDAYQKHLQIEANLAKNGPGEIVMHVGWPDPVEVVWPRDFSF